MNLRPEASNESTGKRSRCSLLRLYVAGGTPNSARAERNLKAALVDLESQADALEVQIVDVFRNAKRALADGVFVTPTLIGQGQVGRLVIMGDLTDSEKLGLMLRSLIETN